MYAHMHWEHMHRYTYLEMGFLAIPVVVFIKKLKSERDRAQR